ncbi:MAG: roadblock/LC7 domain-containing protein [Gemmatimonadales bacterium]|nr:roadblock/LC7 domain-containing protein [Gemmatimonadales bacterium]
MNRFLTETLDQVSRADGVRGARLVSAEDGLVVAEAAMEGIEAAPVAALAASLAGRLVQVAATAGQAPPALIHLEATEGGLFIAIGEAGLLLVAVTTADANAGEVRLALLDGAGRLS